MADLMINGADTVYQLMSGQRIKGQTAIVQVQCFKTRDLGIKNLLQFICRTVSPTQAIVENAFPYAPVCN